MECKNVIVDCDPGTDDAQALLMLLAAHKSRAINILAITCVAGNTLIENVINNVFRILHVCDTPNIPVFKGRHCPLNSSRNHDELLNHAYHGKDGFGDVFTDHPDISELQNESAASALCRIAAKYHDNVTVLCLGPLTNMALAIKENPRFTESVEKFVIMGGNISKTGNTTPFAEFNFYVDPESVNILLSNSQANKILIVPWETCFKCKISIEWRENVYGAIDSPTVYLMKTIEKGALNSQEKLLGHYLCDSLVSAIFLRPDIIIVSKPQHVSVDESDSETMGRIILEQLDLKVPNCNVIYELNGEIHKDLLLFSANPSKYRQALFL